MNQFVELSSDKHSQLRLKKNALLAHAATQQALPIEAVEVTKAATSFPVFCAKNQHGEMTLSAVAGLSAGTSLFMKGEQWDGTYLPSTLQVYPFYLIPSPGKEKDYTVGIQEDNPAFSTEEGEPLFDENGQATKHLEQVSNRLAAELVNIQATVKMMNALTRLDLFKPIELIVQYQDKTAKRINGLYSIDDEKLSKLPANELAELNKEGFLVVVHAMLISVFQVNNLVRRHNESGAQDKVVSIQVTQPQDAGEAA